MRLICIAAAAVALVTSTASAHHLWLEAGSGDAKLFFGEFSENLREASPGLLDRFTPLPEGKSIGASNSQPLKVEKSPGAFVLTGTVAAGDSVVAEQARVTERKQGEKVTRIFGSLAARWVPDLTERTPVLTLDVVPAGKAGSFKVFYEGKPLAKAKIEVIAESGWKRDVTTDEQGGFNAETPWRGLYAIEVEHVDAKAGGEGASAYDRKRYVTTLSFRVADGLAGPAAPPLTVPKRAMAD